MRSHTFAVALIGLSTATAAHASLKSEVEALNKPIEAAFMKRDADGFKKVVQNHMTSDFKYTEGDQIMNFDQMVGGIRQGFSKYSKITSVSMRVLSVKEHGATGTVVESQTMDGIVKGPDKKTHKAAYAGVSTETYRKVNGLWKMATMSIKTEKMTFDGKPMPMGGKQRH
jgi:hypothetical protein